MTRLKVRVSYCLISNPICMAKVLLIECSSEITQTESIVRKGGNEPVTTRSFKTGLKLAMDLPPGSIIVSILKSNDGNVVELAQNLQDRGLYIPIIVHSNHYIHTDYCAVNECRSIVRILQTPALDRTLNEAINKYLPNVTRNEILPGKVFQQKGEKSEQIMAHVARMGTLTSNCVISGEAGLGKERIVSFLHDNSSRNQRPLYVVRHNMFVSENHCGRPCSECYIEKCFNEANGSTLAIIDLPEYCTKGQKLMYGKLHDPSCNVRVVATSDSTIYDKLEAGEFLPNLWYEISEGLLEIPPLRDCPENIEWLAHQIIDEYCDRNKKARLIITDDAMMVLKAYHWPENVTELNTVMKRGAFHCDGDRFDVKHLKSILVEDPKRAGESQEEFLSRILATSPNMSIASIRYGKTRAMVYRDMEKFQLDKNGQKLSA